MFCIASSSNSCLKREFRIPDKISSITYFFLIRRSNSVLPKLSNVPVVDSFISLLAMLSAGTDEAVERGNEEMLQEKEGQFYHELCKVMDSAVGTMTSVDGYFHALVYYPLRLVYA